jgi:hypothetical protein
VSYERRYELIGLNGACTFRVQVLDNDSGKAVYADVQPLDIARHRLDLANRVHQWFPHETPADIEREFLEHVQNTTEHEQTAPSILGIADLVARYPRLRPSVVYGLIREGEVCNIIAKSKVGKSWGAYGLLLSIATGGHWLGKFACAKHKVLLIDNELHHEDLAHRIPAVAAAIEVPLSEYGDNFDVLSLRGDLLGMHELNKVIEATPPDKYGVIVIDAFYRILPNGTSENDNAAMAALYNQIDRWAAITGAAFVLIHHATKGGQADKDVTDVGAGAGSQSRAADTHLILRPHEEEGCVVLEAAVRSWPPVDPITLRWRFPVWTVADDLDPAALKGRLSKTQQRQQDTDREGCAELLTALATEPATVRELRRRTGLSRERCERLLDQLEADDRVTRTAVTKKGNRCREYQLSDVGGE